MRITQSTLFSVGMLASTALIAQEPQQCIQNPTRELPCPHVLIKKTDPVIQQQANLESPTICICVSDFTPLLSAESDSDEQEQSLAWLREWQLSQEQFIRIMRY